MTISSNGKLLIAATKELSLKWEETKQHWQDTKAHEFQQKYMDELTLTVERALPVFEDLDKLVNKVRNDCE